MSGQVIAYVRVSTLDQNPERQNVAIRTALGAEPDRWFTDHASGGSTDRPALAAMLAHVRDQDVIVVASMDRLARSVVDLDQLVTQLTGRGITKVLSFRVVGRPRRRCGLPPSRRSAGSWRLPTASGFRPGRGFGPSSPCVRLLGCGSVRRRVSRSVTLTSFGAN